MRAKGQNNFIQPMQMVLFTKVLLFTLVMTRHMTLDTLIEHFENPLVSYSSCYWLQYKPPAIVQGRFLHSLSQFEDY